MHWLRRHRNHVALTVVIVMFALGLHILDTEINTIRTQGRQLRASDRREVQTITNLKQLNVKSCGRSNTTRGQVIRSQALGVDRQRRSEAATMKSPTATAEQKSVALSNLQQSEAQLQTLRATLVLEDCAAEK